MTDDEMLRELLYEANLNRLSDETEKYVRSLYEHLRLKGELNGLQKLGIKEIYKAVFK